MGCNKPRPRIGGLTISWNDGESTPKPFYKSLDCWAWLTDSEKKELKMYIEPLRIKELVGISKGRTLPPPPPKPMRLRT